MVKITMCLKFSIIINTIIILITGWTNIWQIVGSVIGLAVCILLAWFHIDTAGEKEVDDKVDHNIY